jgi:predicted transcriptional regulator
MAGRKTIAITDRQFAALRVLWRCGPLTVRELMGHLPRGDRQPYTTVLALLQGMEKAGLVVHEKEAQTHRYRSTLTEREATTNLLSDILRWSSTKRRRRHIAIGPHSPSARPRRTCYPISSAGSFTDRPSAWCWGWSMPSSSIRPRSRRSRPG